jgi:hypothetical protein
MVVLAASADVTRQLPNDSDALALKFTSQGASVVTEPTPRPPSSA